MMLSPRFDEALVYASRVHAGQTRPGKPVPYIAHPLAVCSLVLEAGGDEDLAVGGLLHDTAEDHGGRARLEDIRQRFGQRVAAIVEGCSDSLEDPRPPWRIRKERYIEHLWQASDDVLLVSLADKVHNARSILMDYREHGDAIWSRFAGGRDYAAWYLVELARLFAEKRPGPLTDELARVVREIVELMEGAG